MTALIYTHLQMEAALCVWECIRDKANQWPELDIYIANNGYVQTRHDAIKIAKWAERCFDIWCHMKPTNRDRLAGLPYDWEIIPAMVRKVEWGPHWVSIPSIKIGIDTLEALAKAQEETHGYTTQEVQEIDFT